MLNIIFHQRGVSLRAHLLAITIALMGISQTVLGTDLNTEINSSLNGFTGSRAPLDQEIGYAARPLLLTQLPKEIVQIIACYTDNRSCGALRISARHFNNALNEDYFIHANPHLSPIQHLLDFLASPELNIPSLSLSFFEQTIAKAQAHATLCHIRHSLDNTLKNTEGRPDQIVATHARYSLCYAQACRVQLCMQLRFDAAEVAEITKFIEKFMLDQNGTWNDENPEENHRRLPAAFAFAGEKFLNMIDTYHQISEDELFESPTSFKALHLKLASFVAHMHFYAGNNKAAKELVQQYFEEAGRLDDEKVLRDIETLRELIKGPSAFTALDLPQSEPSPWTKMMQMLKI